MIVYQNTPENAVRIGWAYLPEYCEGDSSLPLVLHDHQRGVFIFCAVC